MDSLDAARRALRKTRLARRTMRQPARDLFGEVPVSWPEIYAWCEVVAGIPRDSPRVAAYVRQWCVAEKIAAAKLRGDLDEILSAPPRVRFIRNGTR